ncbi:MAG: alanine racemase, partial [Myxococcota bacterium]|nr:alanine racemase [Myxococcota bacterium]
MQPRSLTELASPACLIEDSILRRNAERMWKKATKGTVLRPHVKTHKCPEIARLQFSRGIGPICVSTLREAESFFSHGFTDITYAVPLSVNLISKAIALNEKVPNLHLLIDHLDTLRHIVSYPLKRPLSLFIKIDCGYHRAGIEPTDPMLLSVAQFIDKHPMLSLQGLLTHAGHSYDCRNQRDILVVADEEEGALHLAKSNLLSVGIRVPTLSLGSTPTCSVKETWNNIDEIRPGNYIFYDLFQASIGSCNIEDIAISVLCEVIGVYPERSSLLINAGALAL